MRNKLIIDIFLYLIISVIIASGVSFISEATVTTSSGGANYHDLTCNEAMSEKLLTGQINNNIATISNPLNQSFEIGFASYKMFDTSIASQKFYDTMIVNIPPRSVVEIPISVPNCMYQLDLVCGVPILPPYYSKNNLLAYEFGNNGNFCSNITSMCSSNTQCGSDGYLGGLFCSQGNVYQNYVSFSCNNAGMANAFCSNSTMQVLKQTCQNGCSNGQCLPPKVSCCSNYDCGPNRIIGGLFCMQGNVYQNYMSSTCNNPGSVNSFCSNSTAPVLRETCQYGCSNDKCLPPPITCSSDIDCGNNHYIPGLFCELGSVYQNFLTFSCNNPGSINSYCSNSTIDVIKQTCQFGCSNGQCTTSQITCHSDTDCGTNRFIGGVLCNQRDVYQNYLSFRCNDPGSVDSFCSNSTAVRLKQSCGFGCSNGQCTKPLIACSGNTDCGTNGYADGLFCYYGDVYQDYTTFNCINPGSINSYCANSTSPVLKQKCQDSCSNGQCLPQTIQCHNNSQCNDGNPNTYDYCQNPGQPNSQCVHQPIKCHCNSDCGNSTYTGGLFCMQGNVFQNDLSFTCNNPSSANSFCSNSTNAVLRQTCQNGCSNGQCLPQTIQCHNNSQCDDGNPHTYDFCQNPGQTNSKCVHQPTSCLFNSDCGTNHFFGGAYCAFGDVYQNYISFICNNPGNANAYCANSTAAVQRQTCQYGCSNGNCITAIITCYNNSQCNDGNPNTYDYCQNPGQPNSQCVHQPIVCKSDSDCQSHNYFQNAPYCRSGNLFDTYNIFSCVSAGTADANCVLTSQIAEVKEFCSMGCENSQCLTSSSYSDDDELYVSDISFSQEDRFYITNRLDFSVKLLNEGHETVNHLHIQIIIPDAGIDYEFGDITLKPGQTVSKSDSFDLPPEVETGSYTAMVSVSNGDVHRLIYREVQIS